MEDQLFDSGSERYEGRHSLTKVILQISQKYLQRLCLHFHEHRPPLLHLQDKESLVLDPKELSLELLYRLPIIQLFQGTHQLDDQARNHLQKYYLYVGCYHLRVDEDSPAGKIAKGAKAEGEVRAVVSSGKPEDIRQHSKERQIAENPP